MSTASQLRPNRPHPQRPGSSHGFTLVAEQREPPDLERFVAALLAFTLRRMEQEKAEREARVNRPQAD